MRYHLVRFGLVVLLLGSVAFGSGGAGDLQRAWIETLSPSMGLAPLHTARISVTNLALAGGSVRGNDLGIALIQFLDTEGEVVAQSHEMSVAPGKTRFWDAPYEQIGGTREPNSRLQLRARVLIEKRSIDRDRRPAVTFEIFDSNTGVTSGAVLTVRARSSGTRFVRDSQLPAAGGRESGVDAR